MTAKIEHSPLLQTPEIFYFIPNIIGYKFSNYGRVISVKKIIQRSSGRKQTFRERILKQQINSNGYPNVTIRQNGRKINLRIHQAVAKAFIINYDNKPILNHKDGNKENNFFKNLEWCTWSENILHAYENNLRRRKNQYMK